MRPPGKKAAAAAAAVALTVSAAAAVRARRSKKTKTKTPIAPKKIVSAPSSTANAAVPREGVSFLSSIASAIALGAAQRLVVDSAPQQPSLLEQASSIFDLTPLPARADIRRGYTVSDVASDGTCGFHAFHAALVHEGIDPGTDATGLRDVAANFIAARARTVYAGEMLEGGVEAHVARIRGHAWAQDPDLTALALAFNVGIDFVHHDGAVSTGEPPPTGRPTLRLIHLGRHWMWSHRPTDGRPARFVPYVFAPPPR